MYYSCVAAEVACKDVRADGLFKQRIKEMATAKKAPAKKAPAKKAPAKKPAAKKAPAKKAAKK